MLALACALLLLFPVISISDDLHADVFTEDLPTKRVVQNAAHLTHPSAIASPVLSLPGPVVSSRVPCEIPAAGSPCRPVYRAALRAPPLAGSR